MSQQHLSPVWTRLAPLVIERGEGCYLYDVNGEKYLDFTSGIGVTNTGHAHPKVVAAIQEQATKILHAQINVMMTKTLLDLTDELRTIVPSHLDSFFFGNSGAEATEGAVKLAKQATKRPNIIVFQGSFHGRTHYAMGMTTSKTVYRVGYQPLPSGIFATPFPHFHRYGWDEDTAVDFCLKELKYLLKSQTAPEETAAIILEPELGEGGYLPTPNRFLQGLRDICDEHGILLIIDEVQTGFGRCGKWFAHEHSGVKADILVMAKGIASGIPMSAIAAPRELMEKWIPGTHGGTYGGNPVAAAAAIATIQVMKEEGIIENAVTQGAYLTQKLQELQQKYPVIGQVRGWGLMVGIEFTNPANHEPDGVTATAIQKACLAQNLLLLTCSTYGNVIRFIPPLVVTKAEIDEAIAILSDAFASVCG